MKKLTLIALAFGASLAFAQPAEPTSPITCSWPSWQGCGNTTGDVVDMTCAAAKAQVNATGSGWFTTEDGGQVFVTANANCSGSETVEFSTIRTMDRNTCVVGEYCRQDESKGNAGGGAGAGGGHQGGHR